MRYTFIIKSSRPVIQVAFIDFIM